MDCVSCVISGMGRVTSNRKRIRGKDYSWGVGSVDAVTMEGCNKALSAARQQADKILEALASGADPMSMSSQHRSQERF